MNIRALFNWWLDLRKGARLRGKTAITPDLLAPVNVGFFSETFKEPLTWKGHADSDANPWAVVFQTLTDGCAELNKARDRAMDITEERAANVPEARLPIER